MAYIQSVTAENRRGKKRIKKEEKTAAKYSGLPYWVAIITGHVQQKYNKANSS